MCIICAKNKGIEMPSWDIIENMWYNNTDGAGLMWVEDGAVRISKGYMKYEDFEAELNRLGERLDLKETPVVMHFRITTHGGTKPENCHPFPITDQIGLLQKLRCNTDVGVAHNGILSFTPRKGISDTMEYIATQLAIIKKMNRKFLKHDYLMQLIKNATEGSRLCFLDKYGKIYTTGNFIEDNGILYSNGNYKSTYFYSRKKNSDSTEKLLCHIDDVDMFIEDKDGKKVDSFAADFYVDYSNNVYSYSYAKDAFYRMSDMTARKYLGSEGFSYSQAIIADVVNEKDNGDIPDYWFDYLCPFDGVVQYTPEEEEWGGNFYIDSKGRVYEELEYGIAVLLENAKACTYDGLAPIYADRNALEFTCCTEEAYYGWNS